MAKRYAMHGGHSRKDFSRKAGHHPKNDLRAVNPMRGGIRL